MIQHMVFHHFKSLHDTTLDVHAVNLLIGTNGAGKSNVIRVFRFMADSVRKDLDSALAPLGGPEGAFFLGQTDRTFALEMEYDVPDPDALNSRSNVSYHLTVRERDGRASVIAEELRVKRNRDEGGRAKMWLQAKLGKGTAVRDPKKGDREPFDTGDPGVLALKALGFLETYPRIRALRQFVESWQFLSVNLEAVRSPRRDMRADTLDVDGANLANVLRTIRGNETYAAILEDLKSLIDTVESLDTEVEKGRVTLLLKDAAFEDPVEVLSVSDGTLRLLALLTALHLMPEQSLLCVEEPEHGIHPLVFGPLMDLIRGRCPKDGSRQVILTTHSPDLMDAAEPAEVVIVERDEQGRTQLVRPPDRKLQRWLKDFRLGELWRMRQLGGVPR